MKVAELAVRADGAKAERESAYPFDKDGGRYRIRTYDFHRVKMALYR